MRGYVDLVKHEHGPGKRWDGERHTCSAERGYKQPRPWWYPNLLVTAGTVAAGAFEALDDWPPAEDARIGVRSGVEAPHKD